MEDILIACVDGLTGFPQAIEAVFPDTEIQQCIIHQIRNTTKFVSYKELKPLMADLKRIYAAPTEEIALAELDSFDETWSGKYPKIAKSWKDNWANLSTYFKYPEAVRRLIYTTNAIEGFNRQLRKVTKSKTVFPSDDSLLKMLYLAMMDITKKWTGHRQNWGQIHSQLEIFFEERLSGLYVVSGLARLARPALLDMSRNGIIYKPRQNLKKVALPRVTNDISYISFFSLHKT